MGVPSRTAIPDRPISLGPHRPDGSDHPIGARVVRSKMSPEWRSLTNAVPSWKATEDEGGSAPAGHSTISAKVERNAAVATLALLGASRRTLSDMKGGFVLVPQEETNVGALRPIAHGHRFLG